MAARDSTSAPYRSAPVPGRVLPPVVDRVWRVEAAVPGRPKLRRAMVVVADDRGRLLIHSAVALDDEGHEALQALGRPAVLVVPNGHHRLDAPHYLERYPDLEVYCPKLARRRVQRVVPVTGTYEDYSAAHGITLRYLPGVIAHEGVLEHRGPDGLVLAFTDLLVDIPHQGGAFGLLYRAAIGTGVARVHRLYGSLIVRDRKALRRRLIEYAGDPTLSAVLLAHGPPVTHGAAEYLREIADRLVSVRAAATT